MTATTPVSIQSRSLPWRSMLAVLAAVVVTLLLVGAFVGFSGSSASKPAPSPVHTVTDQLQGCRPAHPC